VALSITFANITDESPSLTLGFAFFFGRLTQDVLKDEFPKGLDVIYESVGGEMFQTCAKALARGGRMVVIGMMSQYGEGWPRATYPGLCEMLLWKSASVTCVNPFSSRSSVLPGSCACTSV
jgi:NADPH:quinone reductase-like Zn-dependent oxidoreductase